MFRWLNDTHDEETLFVDSTDATELRAQRAWEFIIVLWCTWIFFAFFLWFRGYQQAAYVCIVDSVAHFVLLVWFRKRKNYSLIVNLNLFASAFGLFFVSLSDPAMTNTILFFPVSILVASQLLGVRTAFFWLVLNLVAFALFHVTLYGLAGSMHSSVFDELILLMGVAVCTFFCCQRGEEYYELRTKNLIGLSRRLQQKSKTLHHLATTDGLTGVMNRFQMQAELKQAVDKAAEDGERTALFLLDMDGFKEINDTLGHTIGDDALVEIAARLTKQYGHKASVARLGGDEFCLLYPGIETHEQADATADEICELLTQKYVLSEAEFKLGVSVGVAFCPDDADSDRELLAFADTAMFHAKKNRLGHACYEAAMTDRLIEYRATQELLSHALDLDEFYLVYQPQVDMRSGEVTGVEALLRWQHDGEVIPPFRFISLLEESGEIIRVSEWIIREACRQLAEWTSMGHRISISVNISAVQFGDSDFCQSVVRSIEEYDVDPTMLDFEITEGLLIENIEQAVETLNFIKSLGISISIDDFGTGYSSLAYLRHFPFDRLKIDRAFIKDIPHNDDGTIAASVIVLARVLGLTVLAEGVETEEHIEFLRKHDCDEYQGYYLSKPVSPEEVAAMFRTAEIMEPA